MYEFTQNKRQLKMLRSIKHVSLKVYTNNYFIINEIKFN